MNRTTIEEAAVIGYGTVGTATEVALVSRGTRWVTRIDPDLGHPWPEAISDPWVFVCVPTPVGSSGRMDISAVDSALGRIAAGRDAPKRYVVLRSTVLPGTTDALSERYPSLVLVHWPEFLTESSQMRDALHPARNIVGYTNRQASAAGLLTEAIPDAEYCAIVTARAAEMIKCASNAFYATKVSFWNQIYELCRAHPVLDYDLVRRAMEHDPFCAPQHLDVHHGGYRGYGGSCLPKDVDALLAAANQHGLDLSVLRAAHDYNGKLRGPQ